MGEEAKVPADFQRLPVYCVLDKSGSMSGGPIQALNSGLKELETLAQDPDAGEVAFISVISFSGDASLDQKLDHVSNFSAPSLSAHSSTEMGKALELLKDRGEQEYRLRTSEHKGDYRPFVFIFTDGEPTDGKRWEQALNEFRQTDFGQDATVFAIGCGPSVGEGVLRELAGVGDEALEGKALKADELNQETIQAFIQVVKQTTKQGSKTPSVQDEEVDPDRFEVPDYLEDLGGAA